MSFATTWDEPWQEEIIKESEYLVLGKVVKTSGSKIEVEIEKSISKPLEGVITIDGFFMLTICSMSGDHGPELHFDRGDEGYFFLKKGEGESYQIPTPTSGCDAIVNGQVYATFRHTYHQASISPELYEMAYEVIWKKYHGLEYDQTQFHKFIHKTIAEAPAGFEDEEIDIFFSQHVALESIYLLGMDVDFQILKKFAESDNFHSRVSAFRAMQHCTDDGVSAFLLDYLKDEERDNFSKVIAIWCAISLGDEDTNKALLKLQDDMSDEDTFFGGNIMDPRVCTRFPTPKGAIGELAESDD